MNYFPLFFFNSFIVAQSQDFTINIPLLTQEQYERIRDNVAKIIIPKNKGVDYVLIETIPYRNQFSRLPNQDWGFVSAKTASHEMGHFFGLIHTFLNDNERVVSEGPDATLLPEIALASKILI